MVYERYKDILIYLNIYYVSRKIKVRVDSDLCS
jgi:hypothetical protein